MIYRYPITSLSNLKENVKRHVLNIPQFMLLSTVEYAILLFQIIADNGGHHIEHVLQTFVDYLYSFYKCILRHLGAIVFPP